MLHGSLVILLALSTNAEPPRRGTLEQDIALEGARRHLQMKLEHMGVPQSWSQNSSYDMIDAYKKESANIPSIDDDEWIESHETWTDNGGSEMTTTTYYSPPMHLLTGGAHFTINTLFHIKFPKGDYMITDQKFDIVHGNKANDQNPNTLPSIPLTELYNHHWLLGTTTDPDPLATCEGDYFWGGGAEFRNMDYKIPEGYGLQRIGAKGYCGANLHWINVEDLKLNWEGMNDPKGDHGAAVKNCAECGYAPGRSPGCPTFLDGSFPCCFTTSRCPVNNPNDHKRRSYRLKYQITWTRDIVSRKGLRIHLIDLSGGTHFDKGQLIFGVEWNTDKGLNNAGDHQACNETVCTMTESVTVGTETNFESGLCAGKLIWGYTHMHAGGISSTMSINGKPHCTSMPQIGTDANNTPGNEQGFVVKISECVDHYKYNNSVRLNKGDVVSVTALYDVEKTSKRNFPMPGGKHGGVMAMFFTWTECDDDTWKEKYVCRQGKCFGIPAQKTWLFRKYASRASCEEKCGIEDSGLPEEVQDELVDGVDGPDASVSQASISPPSANATAIVNGLLAPLTSDMEPQLLGSSMAIHWKNCPNSGAIVNVTELTPEAVKIGGTTKIQGSGMLPRTINGGNYTIKMASGALGFTLMDNTGGFCETADYRTLLGNIKLRFLGLSCPLAPGEQKIEIDLKVDGKLPYAVAHTTTTLEAHADDGTKIFCLEVITAGKPKSELPRGSDILV